MSPIRATAILLLVSSTTSALAEQITCESRQNRTEACATVQPGSSVTLVQQLSNSPCIQGRTWGSDNDSLWVSGGCRAVFDVQPPYHDGRADRRHHDRGRDQDSRDQDARDEDTGDKSGRDQYSRDQDSRDQNPGYNNSRTDRRADDSGNDQQQRYDDSRANNDGGHNSGRREAARRACIEQASAGQSFGPDEIRSNDVHWAGQGLFSVSLDTPNGPVTCTVDRDGNVQSLDNG
jgi:Protein of unknown function (DUF3011)